MSINSCRQEKGQGYLKSRGSYSPEIEYRETRLRLTSPKRITVFQCIILSVSVQEPYKTRAGSNYANHTKSIT